MLPTARQLFIEIPRRLAHDPILRDFAEEKLFSSLQLSNGVFKRTHNGRLTDVDQMLISLFKTLQVMPRTFLDVGASSGVSTWNWFESLQRAGLRPSMTATDLTMTVYLVQLFKWIHVLVDKTGFPLQYDVLGVAWRPRSPVRYYPLGNGLFTILWHIIYRGMAKRFDLIKRLHLLRGSFPPPDDPLIKAQLTLITHRLRSNKDIELLEDDLTQPTPAHLRRRFEVIRAANILNRRYFSSEQLRNVIMNLRDRLHGPGDFLLVVRTEETGKNHGTVFRLGEKGSFELIKRIGRGSEIEDVVLSI